MIITENELLMLAEKVVDRYVGQGSIPRKEKDDIKMGIVEKFLIKEEKISNSYHGKAKITTYCIAILNRMCCEIIRKDLKHWNEVNEELVLQDTDYTFASKELIINDEVDYLNRILLLFDSEKDKINVSLSHYYNFPVFKYDLEKYSKGSVNGTLLSLLNNSTSVSKADKFNNLSEMVNHVENKDGRGKNRYYLC